MKNNKDFCPNCGEKIPTDQWRCGWCNFAVDSRDELWKNANMGKQRKKPIANRTGKEPFK